MELIVASSFFSRMACSFFCTVFLSFPDMVSKIALYTCSRITQGKSLGARGISPVPGSHVASQGS